MSKCAELHNLRNSYSGDCAITMHNRSGDIEGYGADRWDSIGSVQSAEADMIDEEERTERRNAKRKFARLLVLYLKKILTPDELKFIAACLQSDKTPYKVGVALGVDYAKVIESINDKHRKNKPKLIILMRYSGYDFRHGLEFLPGLNKYYKRELQKIKYYHDNREYFVQLERAYYLTHPEARRAYYAAHREKYLKYRSEYERTHKDKKAEQNKRYKDKHREELKEKNRLYREQNRAAISARRREAWKAFKAALTPEQLEAHRLKRRESQRAYRAAKKQAQ